MLRRSLAMLVACFAVVRLCTPAAGAVDAQIAQLTLRSQPGDFIGLGSNYDLTYVSPGGFPVDPRIPQTLPTGEPSEVSFWLQETTSSPYYSAASIVFNTTELGLPLQPGTYRNAVRSVVAGPGQPGLDVSFAGRGCNQLTGQFTIEDVSFFRAPSGVLKLGNLTATFEQHCEGASPALFGALTYHNLTAPASVPEPGSLCLLSAGLLPLCGVARRRARSR
ncbi:MAG TPA: PEP-CTERM sorting domain-containing protein [Armatimonadota bacterium]|jgi:hypothetical protein